MSAHAIQYQNIVFSMPVDLVGLLKKLIPSRERSRFVAQKLRQILEDYKSRQSAGRILKLRKKSGFIPPDGYVNAEDYIRADRQAH